MDYSKLVEKDKKIFFRTKFEASGIPFAEGVVLVVIATNLLQNQDSISWLSGIDKFQVAKIMSKLEKKGLISRETNSANKREKLTCLTPAGEEAYKKLSMVVEEWERVCYLGFTPEEIQMYKNMTEKIVYNIQNNLNVK